MRLHSAAPALKKSLFHRNLMVTGLVGISLWLMPTFAAEKTDGKAKQKGLDANLEILNMWGKKSLAINELYSAIYERLDKSDRATFAEAMQTPDIQERCKQMGVAHLGGPMLGCLEPDGVKIWLRTVKPAKVTVEVELKGKTQTFGPVNSTVESDLTAVVPVTGLTPNMTYPYRVFVDGKPIKIPEHAAIRTPPADAEDQTRIAFGTCPHRKGLGNTKLAEQIRAFNPHAMLAYGDIAVQDRRGHLGLHRADYVLRDFHPPWNDLACAIPIYASWDDHDYSFNDGFGLKGGLTEEDRRGIRQVFKQNWNNPYYGLGDKGGGIFTHTRVGCCDIIMTDNRYFRKSVSMREFRKSGKTGKKNDFLGAEQMEWLKKTLLACKGPFIIITCGTMWDDVAAKGKDSWGIWDPEGREEIFQLIEKNKIKGVLFLSGDRHGARIFRIPRPAGHDFYEFEVATLGGRRSITPPKRPEWKTQLYGRQSIYAYGQFIFDTAGEEPTVTHRLVGEDGKILFELKLTRGQLTPKDL